MHPKPKPPKLRPGPPHPAAVLEIASAGLAHERHAHALGLPLRLVLEYLGYHGADVAGSVEVFALAGDNVWLAGAGRVLNFG